VRCETAVAISISVANCGDFLQFGSLCEYGRSACSPPPEGLVAKNTLKGKVLSNEGLLFEAGHIVARFLRSSAASI